MGQFESATGKSGSGREPPREPPSGPPASREAMELRFRRFAEEARRFSREFTAASGSVFIGDPVRSAPRNVQLTRALFAKWSVEILFALYALRELGFQELRDTMGSITPRVLSERLRALEERGLVERKVLDVRPTRVHYSLTEDGLMLARLGEPVFIFLKFRYDQAAEVRRNYIPPRRARSGRTGASEARPPP